MIVTHCTDSLIETGDDSSPTMALVAVGMVCLVTMVFPVSLVSVHNLPFAQFLGFPSAFLEGFSALFYFEQPRNNETPVMKEL